MKFGGKRKQTCCFTGHRYIPKQEKASLKARLQTEDKVPKGALFLLQKEEGYGIIESGSEGMK